MKIAVVGLWHLGTVVAACLAAAGHTVTAYDEDRETIAGLRECLLPVGEPGLKDLVRRGMEDGRLHFTCSPDEIRPAEIIWIAYDTPVDEEDRADVESVIGNIQALMACFGQGVLVLISSQLPVGSTRRLEEHYRRLYPNGTATFAYSPENLRLGKAIDAFTRADRIVVGLRSDGDRGRLESLLRSFTERIEWMGVESAEMTKHALNAFLATSVAFINELATLCERVGASASDVERGLKSDARIGPGAYLRPGSAYAGGTLARDISFLVEVGQQQSLPTHLFSAVRLSNAAHQTWAQRRLSETLGDLKGRRIALLGLTYKPGTDTLRRSSALELGAWLATQGAIVIAYDPAAKLVPAELEGVMAVERSVEAALRGADAAVVTAEWPQFRSIQADDAVLWMAQPIIVDAGRFLESTLAADPRIQYISVGRAA